MSPLTRISSGPSSSKLSEVGRCLLCEHFQVTWQPSLPRACRAYGFKSAEFPSVVVLRESGVPCQLFAPRPRSPS